MFGHHLPRVVRFGMVGVANTTLDIGVFALLTRIGVGVFPATITSTSCGLALSYFLNRHYTFRSATSARRSIIPFLTVTLTGLWLLQPAVIWLCLHFMSATFGTYMIVKLIATGCSMVWNYLWYKHTVFPPSSDHR